MNKYETKNFEDVRQVAAELFLSRTDIEEISTLVRSGKPMGVISRLRKLQRRLENIEGRCRNRMSRLNPPEPPSDGGYEMWG